MYLPGMQQHVEKESPYLVPLIGPVYERTVDGDWPRRCHDTRRHRVICEETKLK